jgi:hypothetical protein
MMLAQHLGRDKKETIFEIVQAMDTYGTETTQMLSADLQNLRVTMQAA